MIRVAVINNDKLVPAGLQALLADTTDDDANKLADAIHTVHSGQLTLTAEPMTLINGDPPELSTQESHVLYLSSTSTPHPTHHRPGQPGIVITTAARSPGPARGLAQ